MAKRTAKNGNGEGTIRQRADGRWEAKCTVRLEGDKQIRKSFYAKTRLEVSNKLRAFQTDHKRGIAVVNDRLTLGGFLDEWLEESVKRTTRPRTYESYSYLVKHHIKPQLGTTPLSRLSVSAVQSWLNEKQNSGLSANTVQRMRAVLRRALRMAEKWGKVSRNVAALADPPKVPRHKVAILRNDQATALLTEAAKHRLEALFAVPLAIGLRLGEAVGLQWNDIDLREGTLTVRNQLQRIRGNSKGEKSKLVLSEPKSDSGRRVIPLPAFATRMLEKHKAAQAIFIRDLEGRELVRDDFVFMGTTGKPLDPRNATRQFKAIAKTAGVPDMRFHDLRHTCASLLLAQGVPVKDVQEILGHSNVRLTLGGC